MARSPKLRKAPAYLHSESALGWLRPLNVIGRSLYVADVWRLPGRARQWKPLARRQGRGPWVCAPYAVFISRRQLRRNGWAG